MNAHATILGRRLRGRPLHIALMALLTVPGSASVAAMAPLIASGPPTLPATNWVVTNCGDSGTGSLRDAVSQAVSGDTVDLTQLDCSVISLTTASLVLGQQSLGIVGPGPELLSIDGSGVEGAGLLYHLGTGTIAIDGLELENGTKYKNNANAAGGCIHSQGNVVITNSNLTGCMAKAAGVYSALGGAVFSAYSTYVANTTLAGNFAQSAAGYASGGGIYALGGLDAVYATVFSNFATTGNGPSWGGGIFARGAATILSSTIANNHSGRMAGVALVDTNSNLALVSNSTISGNTATEFIGGLYSRQTLYLSNSTITDNVSASAYDASNNPVGAGVSIGNQPLPLFVYSTAIVNNQVGSGPLFDLGGSALASIQGSHDAIGTSSMSTPPDTYHGPMTFGLLQDNGGLVLTSALLPSSFGIDAGLASPFAVSAYDERGPGFSRQIGPAVDIGAVEFDPDRIFITGFDLAVPPQPF